MSELEKKRKEARCEAPVKPTARSISHSDEKAGEWAKLAAEEPDARGVEWLGYSERMGGTASQIPRTPQARDLREEVGRDGRASRKKYRMPSRRKPDIAVAGSSKRFAF